MYITAHSGCDGTPDNSPEFIAHALTLSPEIDCLEMDIRKNPAGTLIISHNAADKAFTLAEAFTMIAKGSDTMSVNCDLKQYDLENEVLQTADTCGLSRSRILFSGSVRTYKKGLWPAYMDGIRVFINSEELIPDYNKRFLDFDTDHRRSEMNDSDTELGKAVIARCHEVGCEILNIHYEFARPEFAAMCRESGIMLSLWTPSDEKSITFALDAQPYNITSRRPMLAKKMADER